MPFAYNEGKEGKPATAALYKHEETNSKQVWDEVTLFENDTFYFLFGHCSRFTDIQNFDNRKWEFTPQKISIKISKKDYESTFKGQKKEYKQSIIEKFVCMYLQRLEKGVIYKGTTHLQHIPMVEMVVNGDLASKPELVEANFQSYFDLVPINPGSNTLITLDEFSPPEGGNKGFSGSGAKGQTELEKLNDRMTYFLQQMKHCFPEAKLDNVNDLIKLIAEDGDKPGYVTYCLKVINDVAALNLIHVPF